MSLDISNQEPEVIVAITYFADQLLRLGKETGMILEATDRFPECSLLQTYAAIVCHYAQTKEGG